MTDMSQEKIMGPHSNLKDRSVYYGKGVIGPSAKDIAESNSFASDEQGNTTTKVAVAAGVIAAVAGGGYLLTHQETLPPPPITKSAEPSPSSTVIPTPTGKVEVTIPPTEKPSPSPTEKVLTNAEKIEIARNAQKEAESQGLFKIPVPQVILDKGGEVKEGQIVTGGGRNLMFTVKQEGEIVFPSQIEGTVLQARNLNRNDSYISLQYGERIVNVVFPAKGVLMVKRGDKVTMGMQLFSIQYDPNDPIQKSFEENSSEEKLPQGTVAVLGMRESTGGFKQLSKDNILIDQNNKPISIPTVK